MENRQKRLSRSHFLGRNKVTSWRSGKPNQGVKAGNYKIRAASSDRKIVLYSLNPSVALEIRQDVKEILAGYSGRRSRPTIEVSVEPVVARRGLGLHRTMSGKKTKLVVKNLNDVPLGQIGEYLVSREGIQSIIKLVAAYRRGRTKGLIKSDVKLEEDAFEQHTGRRSIHQTDDRTYTDSPLGPKLALIGNARAVDRRPVAALEGETAENLPPVFKFKST